MTADVRACRYCGEPITHETWSCSDGSTRSGWCGRDGWGVLCSGPDRTGLDEHAPVACAPNGRHGRDGRDYLTCGSIANPAGYCCEHGDYVRPQS